MCFTISARQPDCVPVFIQKLVCLWVGSPAICQFFCSCYMSGRHMGLDFMLKSFIALLDLGCFLNFLF